MNVDSHGNSLIKHWFHGIFRAIGLCMKKINVPAFLHLSRLPEGRVEWLGTVSVQQPATVRLITPDHPHRPIRLQESRDPDGDRPDTV